MTSIHHRPVCLGSGYMNKLAKTNLVSLAGVPQPVTSDNRQPNLFILKQYRNIIFDMPQ